MKSHCFVARELGCACVRQASSPALTLTLGIPIHRDLISLHSVALYDKPIEYQQHDIDREHSTHRTP
jgi:hypothetical protein